MHAFYGVVQTRLVSTMKMGNRDGDDWDGTVMLFDLQMIRQWVEETGGESFLTFWEWRPACTYLYYLEEVYSCIDH